MPDQSATLQACLHKAREKRITHGFGLFILTKCPQLHDYRLCNAISKDELKLWLEKQTHKFVCLIDEYDIILIDSNLPFEQLHDLFTQHENKPIRERTCLELIDFLDELKERANGKSSQVHN